MLSLGGLRRDRRRNSVRKIPDEHDELPALLIGKFLSIRRHGFVALSDDVIELSIGDRADVGRVGKGTRARVVHFGLRTISLPCFAMTFGAFIEVDRHDPFCRVRRFHGERVLYEFGLGRKNPDAAIKSYEGEIRGEGKKDHEKNGDVTSGGRLLFIRHPLNFHTD